MSVVSPSKKTSASFPISSNLSSLRANKTSNSLWWEKAVSSPGFVHHMKYAEIPGVLRGAELAAAYSRMDAFVFPSLTDTFGLVILEAMASGVPVIVNPETGLRVGIETRRLGHSF